MLLQCRDTQTKSYHVYHEAQMGLATSGVICPPAIHRCASACPTDFLVSLHMKDIEPGINVCVLSLNHYL